MAGSPQIQGFKADEVRAGLRLAMTVGLPPITADQPVFYMPRTETAAEPVDSEGVPFNPDYNPVRSPPVTHQVPCAVQYKDGEGKLEGLGIISPTKVILTLLDEDYQVIVGFEYVVIKGVRFWYRRTEVPLGLVTVGLFRIHCASEDEG